MFEVEYRPEVGADFAAIPANLRRRIVRAIEDRLMTEPEQYGTRLRQSLHGLWKLRVGDYRIVFDLDESRVLILAIAHRKKVYEQVARRWAQR